jgi:hypothetical protein
MNVKPFDLLTVNKVQEVSEERQAETLAPAGPGRAYHRPVMQALGSLSLVQGNPLGDRMDSYARAFTRPGGG